MKVLRFVSITLGVALGVGLSLAAVLFLTWGVISVATAAHNLVGGGDLGQIVGMATAFACITLPVGAIIAMATR